ncbi:MAG: DNA replication/repair protein RecF [Paracoccaceae bacterium]|nr:MAG: DNA replication/repair protein RecF [Paracoccaceae bacterium]
MRGLVVTSLNISHFRSHRRAVLVLGGGPAAFFGANGAGKTNVLEAVSMLSPGRGLRRAETADLARRPEGVGWKVAARLSGPDGSHEVETWAEPGAPREVRIDGKPATQTALGRMLRILWLVPAMDRLWQEGAEGRRRFLDRIALSFAPDHGEAVLAYERAMRERNRMLRDQVEDSRWYAAVEAQMVGAAGAISANRNLAMARLATAQDGAETAFPRADLSLSAEDGMPDGADLAAALAAGRRRDMAAGRTLTGPHRIDINAIFSEKGMAAALCSTGEQKALLISLILANARALATDPGIAPVLLLDEVAAHLDPGRRAALYDEIVALGCQAFLTGTEASLFDSLGARGQMFAVADDGGESRIVPA